MFLPGSPLPALDDVQEGQLYHALLRDGSIGTVQFREQRWIWRSLKEGRSQQGTRLELEAWLGEHADLPLRSS